MRQNFDPFGPPSTQPAAAAAAPAGGLPANLVPAQFGVKQDALGFSWMFDGQGMVQGVGNCVFQMGQLLQVNNNNVNFSSSGQAMMTPDQNEFVFVGTANGNLRVTRRAKVNLATGSVRFIDTFQNPGPAAQSVHIQLTTNLRTSASTVVLGPSGTVLGGSSGLRFGRTRIQATLGPKDCGLVAVPRAGYPSPAAIFYLGGAGTRLKPSIVSTSGRDFVFTFNVALAPQKAITIIHGLAQRNAPALDANSLAGLFKVFQSRAWTADLPPGLQKSIANWGKSYWGEDLPGGAVLQPLLGAAARFSVERGAVDVWVQDEQSQLAGKLEGGEITVEGRFGKSTVPLEEVALIVGSAGGEDPMRLYLRNGEVLAGGLTCRELRFKSASGLEAKLLPPQIHYLFLHALRGDGTVPPGAAALVETHQGERLFVREKAGAALQAAMPWGPIQFAVDEVQCLYLRRDPQPIYRLLLKDGSRLPVMLQGDAMDFATLRFGPVKVPAAAITEIRALGQTVAGAGDDEQATTSEPKSSYCTLAGENVLVGDLAGPRLELRTTTGSLSVEAARVQLLERKEEAALIFAVDIGDKEPVLGRLADGDLSIRRGGQVWRLPAHHVLGYHLPKPEAAEDAAAGKGLPPPPADGKRVPPPGGSSQPPSPVAPAPPYLPGTAAPPAPVAPPVQGVPQMEVPEPRDDSPFGMFVVPPSGGRPAAQVRHGSPDWQVRRGSPDPADTSDRRRGSRVTMVGLRSPTRCAGAPARWSHPTPDFFLVTPTAGDIS